LNELRNGRKKGLVHECNEYRKKKKLNLAAICNCYITTNLNKRKLTGDGVDICVESGN
jgi:hypothetical protein